MHKIILIQSFEILNLGQEKKFEFENLESGSTIKSRLRNNIPKIRISNFGLSGFFSSLI